MLRVENVGAHYGAIPVLKGISFHVDRGEIVALIGANGAGKTTTLLVISGLVRSTEGVITMGDTPISGRAPHEIVRLGVVHVPEGRQVFKRLTVLENLRAGAYTAREHTQIEADTERMLARFPVLRARAGQLAGTLSGGEQQMLAIARGLMSRPKIVLLDEPSMGLAPLVIAEVFRLIEEINREGTTILLVEQNANKALRVAHRAYVFAAGRIVLERTGSELLAREEIQAVYLGKGARSS